jgi:predicted MFS family arabinose efflux permease
MAAAGLMADRNGRVPVLPAGVLLIALTAIAPPRSGSELTDLVVGAIVGVGFACRGLPRALLTDWVSPDSRGMFMGIYRFMVDLGFILGPWTVSLALERAGFRSAAWVIVGLTAMSALALLALLGKQGSPIQGAGDDVGRGAAADARE